MLWDKIENLLQEKGYSQRELARRANVTSSVISALKNGLIKKPSFDLMCKIADALEVSLDVFRKKEEQQ